MFIYYYIGITLPTAKAIPSKQDSFPLYKKRVREDLNYILLRHCEERFMRRGNLIQYFLKKMRSSRLLNIKSQEDGIFQLLGFLGNLPLTVQVFSSNVPSSQVPEKTNFNDPDKITGLAGKSIHPALVSDCPGGQQASASGIVWVTHKHPRYKPSFQLC